MKKNLIFVIFLILSGCSAKKDIAVSQICPEVFFSKNHRVFITTEAEELNLDNISFRATINNYKFDKSCKVSNNILQTAISLFFIVQPEMATKKIIELPYYIAVLDEKKEVIDIQYYIVYANFNQNINDSNYTETQIKKKINIKLPYADNITGRKHNILIGFMLDEQKLEILN